MDDITTERLAWLHQMNTFYFMCNSFVPFFAYLKSKGGISPNQFTQPQAEAPPSSSRPDRVFRETDSVEGSARKTKWNAEEDEVLVSFAEAAGLHNWAQAAKRLNQLFYEGRLVRQGKHCRERWFNHLDPNLNSKDYTEGAWTESEDIQLLTLHIKYGNSWSKIARKLNGRNDNSVKNRFNSLVKEARTSLRLQNQSIGEVRSRLIATIRERARLDSADKPI